MWLFLMNTIDQIINTIPFSGQRDGDVRFFNASLLFTNSNQMFSLWIDICISRLFMKYLTPHPTITANEQIPFHITYKQLECFPNMKTTFRMTWEMKTFHESFTGLLGVKGKFHLHLSYSYDFSLISDSSRKSGSRIAHKLGMVQTAVMLPSEFSTFWTDIDGKSLKYGTLHKEKLWLQLPHYYFS